MPDQDFFVYIMANKRNGTVYIGMTNNLQRRVHEHREGLIKGFTRRYGLKMIVYYEVYDSVASAIQRETNLKRWHRKSKLDLIEARNPQWRDLYDEPRPSTPWPGLTRPSRAAF